MSEHEGLIGISKELLYLLEEKNESYHGLKGKYQFLEEFVCDQGLMDQFKQYKRTWRMEEGHYDFLD